MNQTIKRGGVQLCVSTVPYPKKILLDMANNGLTVFQNGKKLTKKDILHLRERVNMK